MHRRFTACLVVSILCYGKHGQASAFEGEFQGEVPSAGDSTWYGWQTLTADGIALVVLPTLSLATEQSAPMALGLVGSVFASPIIHTLYDNDGTAVGSLVMRVGLPLLGATLVGAYTDCPENGNTKFEMDLCPLPQQVVGAYGGMVTAALFDAAALAYTDDKQDDGLWMNVRPSLTRESTAAKLTVQGTF